MVVIEKHKEILEALGLATLEDVRSFKGQLVKNQRGHRDILKVDATDASGRELVLFLKRNLKPYRKDGLQSLIRRGAVWSMSRQEWENFRLLDAAGMDVAGRVAYGEECGLLGERFSFLITEAARGGETLGAFLNRCHAGPERRRVLGALAERIRSMHEAGLATPDLIARHIFVDSTETPARFCLIDMARLDQERSVSIRQRARDLTALHLSVPRSRSTWRERLRFLLKYAPPGLDRRSLFKQVEERANHLLKRHRYRRFFEGEARRRPVTNRSG